MSIEKRVSKLEKALEHFSRGLWKLSDEVAINRKGKNNPLRQALERRVRELENKFFAFQCGAQEQMKRDQAAIAEAEAEAQRQKRLVTLGLKEAARHLKKEAAS
jgi:hypothetical protein